MEGTREKLIIFFEPLVKNVRIWVKIFACGAIGAAAPKIWGFLPEKSVFAIINDIFSLFVEAAVTLAHSYDFALMH